MIKDTIKKALELKEKYSGSISMLLKDYGIKVFKDESLEDIYSYTISIRNKDLIVINPILLDYEYNFVICHEIFHIIEHDNTNRSFSHIIGNDRFELQANIFAVIYLDIDYVEEYNDISKSINYALSTIRAVM